MRKKTGLKSVMTGLLIVSILFLAQITGAQVNRGQERSLPDINGGIFGEEKRADSAFTPSAYRLIGTIEGGDFIGAVIDDSAGIQSFYRLYDRLPDGSKVMKVRDDSILLKRSDGVTYELYIAHDTKANVQAPSPVNAGPLVVPAVSNIQQAPDEQNRPEWLKNVPPGAGPRGRRRARAAEAGQED